MVTISASHSNHARLLLPPADRPPAIPRGRKLVVQRLLWALGQIVLFFMIFQVYKIVRKSFIPPDASHAFENARDIIHLQESMNLFFELEWQRWALDRPTWFISLFNNLYAYYQWWVFGGLAILAFFAPERFKFMRRAFFILIVLVSPMYALYPLAPPRFMDAHGWPFVDTLAVYGPNYFSEAGLVQANRYAAMPSMHVGWTTFTAVALTLLIPYRWARFLLVAFIASLITYIVIITGNHWWIDALVGVMFLLAALFINKAIPYPLLSRAGKAAGASHLPR